MPRSKTEFKRPAIDRMSDGRYRARVYMGTDPYTKKKIQKSVYGKTESEVITKARVLQEEKMSRQSVAKTNFTVKKWIEHWLVEHKATQLKTSVIHTYRSTAETYIYQPGQKAGKPDPYKFGDIKLEKLTADHVRHLYNALIENGLSPATVRVAHRVLHAALVSAVDERLIPENPSHRVKLPRANAKPKVPLNDEEWAKLSAILNNTSYGHGVLFLFNCGMRIGEMLALHWRDVDFENRVIRVAYTLKRVKDGDTSSLQLDTPKTADSERSIPMSDALMEILQRQKEYAGIVASLAGDKYVDAGVVFCAMNGNYMEPKGFSRYLYKTCKTAGIRKISPHVMRHTFITNAVKNHVDPRDLRRIVGHSSDYITDRIYTHLDTQSLMDSMEQATAKKTNAEQ